MIRLENESQFMRNRKNRYWFICAALALALLGVFGVQYEATRAASSATLFVVSAAVDLPDATPGDGICDIGNSLCTLRAAIQEANATPGQDVIEFGAMPVGINLIGLGSPLPIITDSIQIHGQTHPNGMITLDGGGVLGSGFYVTAGNSEIVGFRIHNFAYHGINLAGNGNNNIHDNIIGLPLESGGPGNGGDGILVDNITSNTIQNNVISNNGLNGIELFGSGAYGNSVTGNRVGTNAFGNGAIGNVRDGIYLNGAPQNTIGGTFGNGNLISGNGSHGIEVAGLQASNNVIVGNLIGSNNNGDSDLPNGKHGIFIYESPGNTIGSVSTNLRNLISGNLQDGILIHGGGANNNQVLGNYIGTTVNGLNALGNGESGVHINRSLNNFVGGTAVGAGNLISGNGGYGVEITSDTDIGPGPVAEQNTILGNLIGTNHMGTTSVGNGFGGVLIFEASNNTIGGITSGARNIIAGNYGNGVEIADPQSNSNDVFGNYIGLNISGTMALSNTGSGVMISDARLNHIGSGAIGGSNVIGGNGAHGIHIFNSPAILNSIHSNLIGMNWLGTTAVANQLNGIFIEKANSTIVGGTAITEGNTISGNGLHGVLISGTLAYNNQIIGNRIGTNLYSSAAVPNAGNGLTIYDAGNNQIGTDMPDSGNLISGNGKHGILISGSSASFNTIKRNHVGTDLYGDSAIANSVHGISIENAPQNVIGSALAPEGNLIGGNQGHGISISGTGSISNTIGNNLIGTNYMGTERLPNALAGIGIQNAVSNTIGGNGWGNLISANIGPGIVISGTQSSGNRIWSNRIGTNFMGTAALNNFPDGVRVDGAKNTFIGGVLPGQGNLISGHAGEGISIGCQGSEAIATTIRGNLIGTNITGSVSLSNYNGIEHCYGRNTMIGGAMTGARNLISGNNGYGIYSANDTATYFPMTIQGNYIGTNIAGTAVISNGADGISLPNPQSLIGGSVPGAGNLISGNERFGINVNTNIVTMTIQIQGNLIGTDASGNFALGNKKDGININGNADIGGNTASVRNIISGNGGCGISKSASASQGSRVQGNYIGTNISGTQSLGNNSHGICFNYQSNGMLIGGTIPGAGNRIAFNNGAGIYFEPLSAISSAGHIRRNSIYSNGDLGIDLTPEIGPTPNDLGDGDVGPNDFQNYPVLTGVRNSTGFTVISGTLNSQGFKIFTIEFFANSSCDGTGYGEGETYLGDTTISTDFYGDAIFAVVLPTTIPPGQYVTMTAIDSLGNTSEFSQCPAQPTAVTLLSVAAVTRRSLGPVWLLLVSAIITFTIMFTVSKTRR